MSRLRWRSSVLCRWAGTRVFSARHLSIPCLRPALIATTALNAGWVASATGSNRYWACAFPRHPKRFTARTACAALRCSKPLHVLGERQARARANERGWRGEEEVRRSWREGLEKVWPIAAEPCRFARSWARQRRLWLHQGANALDVPGGALPPHPPPSSSARAPRSET